MPRIFLICKIDQDFLACRIGFAVYDTGTFFSGLFVSHTNPVNPANPA
jgi:hypothetical protein